MSITKVTKDVFDESLTPVGGSVDAIILTPTTAIIAYVAGQTYHFLATGANTAAVTVAVSGLAVKSVTKDGTTVLLAGDIPASGLVSIRYDGTQFQLVTPSRVSTVAGKVNLSSYTATGDLLVGTGAGTVAALPVGAAGTIPMSRTASALKVAYVPALTKAIYGLTYANNVGDATNDLDIAAGGAMDATGAYFLVGSALTKQSDVLWTVGNNQGALDTGAAGNSDYYIWMIGRSDTGVVDYLYSLSSTAPDMTRPTAAYDFKRLIGWFKRVGATIVAFTTYETDGGGLELLWSSPTLDINLANTLTTTRRTDAVKVPLNFSVLAHLNVRGSDAAALFAIVYCPDQADLVPSGTVAPLMNVGDGQTGQHVSSMRVRTSATGTIAARATTATIDLFVVATMGFTWARRN